MCRHPTTASLLVLGGKVLCRFAVRQTITICDLKHCVVMILIHRIPAKT